MLLESTSVSATNLSPDAALTALSAAMYADVRPRVCAGDRAADIWKRLCDFLDSM